MNTYINDDYTNDFEWIADFKDEGLCLRQHSTGIRYFTKPYLSFYFC